MVRIVHLIPGLGRSGAARQLALLACGLPRGQFDAHVVAMACGGPLADALQRAGVPVQVVGQRWAGDVPAFWRLCGEVARLRPDVVHSWATSVNACAYAVAAACGVRRLVVGQRCIDPWRSRPAMALDRWIARRAVCTVVNSSAVRDACCAQGWSPATIHLIPDGVPPAVPGATSRGQLLVQLGLPAGGRLIAVVGPLTPRKRFKDAIWAADLLKVIRDDVYLLILGDGPHRRRLVTFRDQVEIRDKVFFLGEREDVGAILTHCDVLWSPGDVGGVTSAILEAMAAGRPVIAADVPATRDLVVHGQTGYLVPAGDRAGIARFTNTLLDDPARAGRLGAAGRQRAAEQFSVAAMIRRHADLYTSATTSPNGWKADRL